MQSADCAPDIGAVSKQDLPSSDEPVADRKDAARLARQVEANDIKWLMSSKQGRRIAWRLLERAGVYRSSFTGNSETFFREGQRDQGLRLIADIHTHCPDAYALMLTEAKATP